MAKEKSVVHFTYDYDNVVDQIEKKFRIGSTEQNANLRRANALSTGILSIDLMLGGGILPGGWYTNFGPEQSCKSTLVQHLIASAIDSNVPIVHYWDFEGCVTEDTLVVTPSGVRSFASILEEVSKTITLPTIKGWIEGFETDVTSANGEAQKAKVYYGGERETCRIEAESGHALTGANHPVLVVLPDGSGIWKKIEDVKVGDEILISTS